MKRRGGPRSQSSAASSSAGAAAASSTNPTTPEDEDDDFFKLQPHEQSLVTNSVFRVVDYLKAKRQPCVAGDVRSSTGVAFALPGEPSTLLEALQSDEYDAARVARCVSNRLLGNAFVRIEDGFHMTYEHELTNVKDLRTFIEQKATGVSREALVEHNPREWGPECARLLHDGGVLAVMMRGKKRVSMYPRGHDFLVQLPGTVSAQPGDVYLTTSEDLRKSVRRGDLIIVDGRPYRVSAQTVQDDSPDGDSWLRKNLRAPYSSSSVGEGPKPTHRFAFDFDERRIPIHPAFASPVALRGGKALKHGCTNDVRERWLDCSRETNNNFTTSTSDKTRLDDQLRRAHILTEDQLREFNRADLERQQRRRQNALASQQAPGQKRRRAVSTSRKATTNAHMLGGSGSGSQGGGGGDEGGDE